MMTKLIGHLANFIVFLCIYFIGFFMGYWQNGRELQMFKDGYNSMQHTNISLRAEKEASNQELVKLREKYNNLLQEIPAI